MSIRTLPGRILLGALVLAMPSERAWAQAAEAFYEPERVAAIAAVSNPDAGPDLPFRSGLFVAYTGAYGGRVEYFQDALETYQLQSLTKSALRLDFEQPTAIAERDGNLVVWDAGDATLYRVDLRTGGKTTPLWRGAPLIAPTQIAISPDGYVLLVDSAGGNVFWTTLEGGKIRHLEGKTRSVSIAIPSWDTLAVLDREQQSIRIFTLMRTEGGLLLEPRSELSLSERERLDTGEFQTLAAQDGALYVADRSRIYSYIESTGALIPAATDHSVLDDVTHLQVTYDNFYVVDGDELRSVTRTVPVEVVLDTLPHVAQTALLDLYDYLYLAKLLPFEEAVATEAYATLEEYLIAQSVFAAPASAFPARKGFRLWPFGRRTQALPVDGQRGYDMFVSVFCENNRSYCAEHGWEGVFGAPVRGGTRLMLPKTRLQSTVGLREVVLERPVSEYLDALVIHPELKGVAADYSLLRRVNESARNMEPERFYAKSNGEVTLPYQVWALTVAVPVDDYDRPDSMLYDLQQYEGVSIYSRQAYVEQAAYTHHTAAHALERCEALKERYAGWLEDLRYPSDYPRFVEGTVRVGVLENSSHVRKAHQVFSMDATAPTWHEVTETLDFVPQPQPASFEPGGQVVDAIDVFSIEVHHGTHVSALLGGRRGDCWSGLLPKARLMLIDTSNAAQIAAGLFDSKRAFISTLNVSQKLADESSLHRLLSQRHRTQIFVLAAGNNGVDLNVNDDDSAVKWGTLENVIVVTGFHYPQPGKPAIIPGLNAGKRYVDLAAPGADIMSASGERSYGPASGTSQAAPAVAAAVAYLADEEEGWGKAPDAVKARLIATADWHDDLRDKVWGGTLNLGDAVRFPDRDVLHTHTRGKDTHFTVHDADNARFTIDSFPASLYERRGDDAVYGKREIRLQLILSLKSNGDGSYRVVFRDPDTHELRIMLNAELSGRLRCGRAEEWDAAAQGWKPSALCDQPIGVGQILHYYKALTYHVEWT